MTADELAWVLVDSGESSVLDHDALPYDAEIAGAAARGAQAIAQACGYELDGVGVTWSEDITREGLRLRSRLGCLGLRDAEAVPVATATVLGGQVGDVAPRLGPAYGAALAVVTPGAAMTLAVAQPVSERLRTPRRRTVSAVLGVAAAAIVGALCLSAGAAPPVEPAGTVAEPPVPPSDSGWVSVPAPSGPAADVVRKVVAAGPTPGPDAPVSTPPTDAEMTELVNVFTALP
ncbi:MAG: hypothetical protein WA944_11740 [Mycobacterium sp.]